MDSMTRIKVGLNVLISGLLLSQYPITKTIIFDFRKIFFGYFNDLLNWFVTLHLTRRIRLKH